LPTFYRQQEEVDCKALLTWNFAGIKHYRVLMGGQAVGCEAAPQGEMEEFAEN